MNKRKQTFNQLLNNLPPLKNINSEDRLPGYFDMMWDIKYGHQLFDYLKTHNNPDVYSALARHGYDAKKPKKQNFCGTKCYKTGHYSMEIEEHYIA